MSLFGKVEKQEIARLKRQIEDLKTQIDSGKSDNDILRADNDTVLADNNTLRKQIDELEQDKKNLQKELSIPARKDEICRLDNEIAQKRNEIIHLDDVLMLESFGLYTPKFEFVSVDEYRAKLEKIRTQQKELIRDDLATQGGHGWTVDKSAAKGAKMVKDMQKLLLRAFNAECDEAVTKVKYNNFETSLRRITSSFEAVSKLGAVMSISISRVYYELKIDELRIALEYQIKKQEEKETQKEIRAQLREEAKLQKEIEDQRRKLEKEQMHYENALFKINQQIETASDDDRADLIQKREEYLAGAAEVLKAIQDVDYRQANQRAGYVYIISNIGAFGENVYKIGMTRRLDPQERVDELGDASVPFNFDIHAMIFSDDAPSLENALHKAFESKKLNWINQRREFFNVSLGEIKDVVKKNHDKTVEFVELADAEQYRASLRMRGVV